MEDSAVKKRRRWWLAGFLSFLVPGLGQVYNGQETKGLFYYVVLSIWGGFLISLVKYLLTPPVSSINMVFMSLLVLTSLILWIFIIFEAVQTARRISGDYTLKGFNKWYVYIIIIAVISLADYSVETVIVKNMLFRAAYKIPTGSMSPTLLPGDHIVCDLGYYLSRNPARGDIIIFKWPGDERIEYAKRIIGIPGDTVGIVDDDLYVNNKKLELMFVQKYSPGEGKEADVYQETVGDASYRILDQVKKHENFGPVTVPEGEYFVMGDNRDNSDDSRYWGMVKRHQIRGVPAFVYFSWDMKIPAWNIFGRLASIRISRIGKILE